MAEELRQGEWGPTPLDEPPEEGNPDFPEWSEVVGAIKRDDANSVRIVPEPPNEMGLLHYAVLASALTCAEKLLDSNADVDARSSETVTYGWTPLHAAAHEARDAACRLLLARGADPNARTFKNYTPLHYAVTFVRKKAASTVEVLLGGGADPSARTTTGGHTPLHLATQYCGDPAIVAMLLAAGSPPNARTRRTDGITEGGRTALHYAAINRTEKTGTAAVRALMKSGAAVNVLDAWRNTPLAMACEAGRYATARALVEAGGSVQFRGRRVPENTSIDDMFESDFLQDADESAEIRRLIALSTRRWTVSIHRELGQLCSAWVATVLLTAHRLESTNVAPRMPAEMWYAILELIPIPEMKAALPHVVIGHHTSAAMKTFDFD